MLKKRKSASISPESGHTRAVQKIRITQKIILLDTPGVIPYQEKDNVKHGIIGTTSYQKIKDPERIIFEIMREFPNLLEEYYELELEDPEEILEKIAEKKNLYQKGKEPDTNRASQLVLKDWQLGKIKLQQKSQATKRDKPSVKTKKSRD